MTEEIKEILEKLKDNIPIEEYRGEGTSDGLTHYEEDKDSWQYKLLNYITNLKKENEKLQTTVNNCKQTNEKAIKWLENHIKMINGLAGDNDGLKGSIVLSDDIVVNSLLYILQGGDE